MLTRHYVFTRILLIVIKKCILILTRLFGRMTFLLCTMQKQSVALTLKAFAHLMAKCFFWEMRYLVLGLNQMLNFCYILLSNLFPYFDSMTEICQYQNHMLPTLMTFDEIVQPYMFITFLFRVNVTQKFASWMLNNTCFQKIISFSGEDGCQFCPKNFDTVLTWPQTKTGDVSYLTCPNQSDESK